MLTKPTATYGIFYRSNLPHIVDFWTIPVENFIYKIHIPGKFLPPHWPLMYASGETRELCDRYEFRKCWWGGNGIYGHTAIVDGVATQNEILAIIEASLDSFKAAYVAETHWYLNNQPSLVESRLADWLDMTGETLTI